MIITVNKIGTGTMNDRIRPDVQTIDWQVVEERETEFVIEVIEE